MGDIPLGQELFIKVRDPAAPTTWVDFCGVVSTDFTLGPDFVERVKPICDGDRTTPAPKTNRAGNLNYDFTGSGLYEKGDRTKAVLDAARTGTTAEFQVIVPDYGTFEGECYVKATLNGNTNEDLAASFEFGWKAMPTFTAVV